MNIQEFFKKETAGLPNGVWLIVIVVGVGVGYFFNQRNQQPVNTTPVVDNTPDSYQASGANAGSSIQPQPYQPPPVPNINWFVQAFGPKNEISEQCGHFYLVLRGSNGQITSSIDLGTLFPQGTIFYGQGAGDAFALTPGSQTPVMLTTGGYGKPAVDCTGRR